MSSQISDEGRIIIISENDKSSFYFWFFRVGGIFFMALCLISIYSSVMSNVELLSTLAIGLFGVILFFYFPSSDILKIYKHKIEIFSFYGKSKKIIVRKEIKAINEIIKPTKFGNFNLFEIKTNNTKYRVSEVRYANYIQMKNEISSGF